MSRLFSASDEALEGVLSDPDRPFDAVHLDLLGADPATDGADVDLEVLRHLFGRVQLGQVEQGRAGHELGFLTIGVGALALAFPHPCRSLAAESTSQRDQAIPAIPAGRRDGRCDRSGRVAGPAGAGQRRRRRGGGNGRTHEGQSAVTTCVRPLSCPRSSAPPHLEFHAKMHY